MTMLQTYAGTQTLAVWTTIKWLLHRYEEHRRRRRAVAELESVDPRILKDIGIDRTEATSNRLWQPKRTQAPLRGR